MTRDGYSNMVFFPEDFPWKNKSLKEMLGPKFLKVRGLFRGGIIPSNLSFFARKGVRMLQETLWATSAVRGDVFGSRVRGRLVGRLPSEKGFTIDRIKTAVLSFQVFLHVLGKACVPAIDFTK